MATADPRVAGTRQRVLREARRLLVDEGITAVTFEGISKRTGVSRTTLYRHWPRPVDLLIEAYEQLTRPAPVEPTADLRADLVATFVAARNGMEQGEWRRVLPSLVAAAETDPELRALHTQFTDDRRTPVLERLRRARAAGLIDADADIDLAVDVMAGVLFYRRLLRHCPTPEHVVAAVVDATLADLGWERRGASRTGGRDRRPDPERDAPTPG